MNDTIYRRDAIQALIDTEEIKGLAYRMLEDRLIGLPSANKWIPCSERLPEKAGHYLCSFKKANRIDNIYVDLAYWTGGRWYGYLANEINAWMPLPEPWKGADDD